MSSLSGRRPLKTQICPEDVSYTSPEATDGANGLTKCVKAGDETSEEIKAGGETNGEIETVKQECVAND